MATYTPSKPVESMTKLEMVEKIKSYRFVLFKLHKEMEAKDEEIKRLTYLLDKAQKQSGKQK